MIKRRIYKHNKHGTIDVIFIAKELHSRVSELQKRTLKLTEASSEILPPYKISVSPDCSYIVLKNRSPGYKCSKFFGFVCGPSNKITASMCKSIYVSECVCFLFISVRWFLSVFGWMLSHI